MLVAQRDDFAEREDPRHVNDDGFALKDKGGYPLNAVEIAARQAGRQTIAEYAGRFVLPARTDWTKLVAQLEPGRACYAVNVDRARTVERCLADAGLVFRRDRLREPDHGYLVWSLGRKWNEVRICEPCAVAWHGACSGAGCVCRHELPVVPGDRVERTSEKWMSKARELRPGRAFLVASYGMAVQLERAVGKCGMRGAKVKLWDGTYLVWNLGERRPMSLCAACETGRCWRHPERCQKGLVRGKRSPVECECGHEAVHYAFPAGNVEKRVVSAGYLPVEV